MFHCPPFQWFDPKGSSRPNICSIRVAGAAEGAGAKLGSKVTRKGASTAGCTEALRALGAVSLRFSGLEPGRFAGSVSQRVQVPKRHPQEAKGRGSFKVR